MIRAAAAFLLLTGSAAAASRAGAQPTALAGEWHCMAYSSVTRNLMTHRFTLHADGTYTAAGDTRGRFRYDAASGRITWVDGAHVALYEDTRVEKDANGTTIIRAKVKGRAFRCRIPSASR